jgi:hypothetical protein
LWYPVSTHTNIQTTMHITILHCLNQFSYCLQSPLISPLLLLCLYTMSFLILYFSYQITSWGECFFLSLPLILVSHLQLVSHSYFHVVSILITFMQLIVFLHITSSFMSTHSHTHTLTEYGFFSPIYRFRLPAPSKYLWQLLEDFVTFFGKETVSNSCHETSLL